MRLSVPIVVALAGILTFAVALPATQVSQAQTSPRNVTVLAGVGQDTIDVLAFFPQNIRIRAGETITWKQNSDAGHTVSFVGSYTGPGGSDIFLTPGETVPSPNLPMPGQPGVTYLNPVRGLPYPGPEVFGSTYSGEGYVSSGRLASKPQTPGLPERFSFSLTFDRPGTYRYLCLTHADQMQGAVEVLPTSATGLPSQAEIDAQAQAQITALMALMERTQAQRPIARNEPGPADNTVWYVSAGNHWYQINDQRAALQEFLPRNISVTSGDTVVWGSTGFHSVTFNPVPPEPPDLILGSLPDGSEVIVNNPLTREPHKPAAIYDPTQFFNSGNLSPNQPNGTAWTLTFDRPGTFEYYCSVHLELGMRGAVTVVERS
jgi:plastocyanin